MQSIEVQVRYATGAYNVQAKGQRASSTSSAQSAAERLGQKLMGPSFGRVEELSRDGAGSSRWRICAIERPSHAELLEWLDAIASKPDADILVLLWIEDDAGHCDWDAGWWSCEEWLLAESGGSVRGTVRFYARPDGPSA